MLINSAGRADDGIAYQPGDSASRAKHKMSKETMASAGKAEGLRKTKKLTTEIQVEKDLKKKFEKSLIKIGEKKLEIQDPLIEINIGLDENRQPSFISANFRRHNKGS